MRYPDLQYLIDRVNESMTIYFKHADIMAVKKLCDGPPKEFGYIIKDHIGTVYFGEGSIIALFSQYIMKDDKCEFRFKPRNEQPEINMDWFTGCKQYDTWLNMCLDGWVID